MSCSSFTGNDRSLDRATPRLHDGGMILIATCEEWPNLHPDDRGLLAAFAERDMGAAPAVWNDPDVDWPQADAVLLRSTWDYSRTRDAFLRWLEGLSVPVFNPPAMIRWNTDKRYLDTLGLRGVPVVPTVYVDPGHSAPETPLAAQCVVKPSVSAGSQDTIRLEGDNRPAIERQVARIHRQGKTAMIQPYLANVDSAGETALLFIDGEFSHSVRKGPMLPEVGRLATDGLFAAEAIESRAASAAELELGFQVIRALPFETPVYTRVDLIPGADGAPVVLEAA